MSGRWDFPRRVGYVLLAGGLLGGYPLIALAEPEVRYAAAAGVVLSTLNVLGGYLTIEYAFNRSYSTFLKAVLGGMGIRMALMLGLVLVMLVKTGLNPAAFIGSMFASYLVYLVLEIVYLQEKVSEKNQR